MPHSQLPDEDCFPDLLLSADCSSELHCHPSTLLIEHVKAIFYSLVLLLDIPQTWNEIWDLTESVSKGFPTYSCPGQSWIYPVSLALDLLLADMVSCCYCGSGNFGSYTLYFKSPSRHRDQKIYGEPRGLFPAISSQISHWLCQSLLYCK